MPTMVKTSEISCWSLSEALKMRSLSAEYLIQGSPVLDTMLASADAHRAVDHDLLLTSEPRYQLVASTRNIG